MRSEPLFGDVALICDISGIESVPDSDAAIKRLVDGLLTLDLTSVVKTEFDGEADVAKVLLPVEKTSRVEVLRRTFRLKRLVVSEVGREIAKLEVSKESEGTNVGVIFEPVVTRVGSEEKTPVELELCGLDKIGVTGGTNCVEAAARLEADAADASNSRASQA